MFAQKNSLILLFQCNYGYYLLYLSKDVYLYHNSNLSEKKKQENNPIYNNNKRTSYLGINLTKQLKKLYSKTINH